MALIFNTPIELPTGLTVADAYGRVAAVDQMAGTQVDAIVDIYVSEAAYLAGKEALTVSFNRTAGIPYNRDVDGTDILNIGHQALMTVLATEGYTTTKVLS
tara:strand:- start:9 stop:311 length:303 start_codon:yes stop_codon:yes gene_type:complete